MPTILNNNFRAMFNELKSPLVANVLIERALQGDYSRTKEIGPGGEEPGVDKQIIGTLYLMTADENTYPLVENVEAFVLRIEHEARLVDFYTFPDVSQAEVFMSATN